MAEGKSEQSGKSKFVSAIVKDPNAVPQTRLLTGFAGASSEKDHRRVYLDAELQNHVDIPTDAVPGTSWNKNSDGFLGRLQISRTF